MNRTLFARGTAVVGDVELAYEQTGEGEPFVLIMGIGTQLVWWHDELVCDLASRGYRVIRFDNRDIGQSTHQHHYGRPALPKMVLRSLLGRTVPAAYSLWDMADDTAGLMDALNIRSAHVAGVSMGGMVAQSLAIRHPARVRTLTSWMSTPDWRFVSQPKAVAALLTPRPRSRDEAGERAVEVFGAIGSPGFARDNEHLRAVALRSWDRAPANPDGFLRQFAAIIAGGNREAGLRRVSCPSMVIHGDADPLIPVEQGLRTAHYLPGSRLEIIKGMGHDMPRVLWPRLIDLLDTHARP